MCSFPSTRKKKTCCFKSGPFAPFPGASPNSAWHSNHPDVTSGRGSARHTWRRRKGMEKQQDPGYLLDFSHIAISYLLDLYGFIDLATRPWWVLLQSNHILAISWDHPSRTSYAGWRTTRLPGMVFRCTTPPKKGGFIGMVYIHQRLVQGWAANYETGIRTSRLRLQDNHPRWTWEVPNLAINIHEINTLDMYESRIYVICWYLLNLLHAFHCNGRNMEGILTCSLSLLW